MLDVLLLVTGWLITAAGALWFFVAPTAMHQVAALLLVLIGVVMAALTRISLALAAKRG